MANHSYKYNVIIIGDSGIGKSSLMTKFCTDEFSELFTSTIGVDFKSKSITIDDKSVKFYIWDTAGQERFRSITRSYYGHAHGIILAFDCTSKESFTNIKEVWIPSIYEHNKTEHPIILVGCKIDKDAKREVYQENIDQLLISCPIPMKYVEVSAKNGEGVVKIFELIGRDMIEKTSLNIASNKESVHENDTIQVQQTYYKYVPSCCSF